MALHSLFVLLFVSLTLARKPDNCNNGNDAVKNLPGYNGPKLRMNSGFIEVNQTANGSMFYWMVHAIDSKPDTPLLIWLNGGPGASSLTALFAENGPFRINTKDLTLDYWNSTWATYYHMLFIDNPIDTGFSFCNDGQQVQDEDQMGANFAVMMKAFYECHPELKDNDLYITGESYAGRYIPFIAKHFLLSKIPLAGLAIGNGIWDPFIQFPSLPYYAFVNGILDHEEFVAVNETVNSCLELAALGAEQDDRDMLNQASLICLDVTNAVYGDIGGHIFQYDIRRNDETAFDQISSDIAKYLKQPAVVEAIHTEGIPWKSSDGTSAPNAVADALNYDIVLNNSAALIPDLLLAGVRILYYNGQFDGSVCNNYGNEQCLAQLNYKGEWNDLKRNPMFLDDKCIGYCTVSTDSKLTYTVVSDSGHLVPYDAPESILAIIHNWVEDGITDLFGSK